MSHLHALAPYVPLFQTLIWVAVILIATKVFYPQLRSVLNAIQFRIKTGSSVKAGPFELGQDLRQLQPVPEQAAAETLTTLKRQYDYAGISSEVAPEDQPTDSVVTKWNEQRNRIYQENDNVFLTHVIRPSKERGQKYDVFIYLIRHGGQGFDDIEYAEFFLGRYWENKVFRRTVVNGRIGLSTAAYGTFLCLCSVHMKNGTTVSLSRYIDFEMAQIFEGDA